MSTPSAVPVDDGAADHLPGRTLPSLTLLATDGRPVDLADLGPGRTVLYAYPMTARPGVDLPANWDEIPGARGCTPEACSFRDHHAELAELGARVYGLSSQDTAYQREAVERLRLPFAMLADPDLTVARALDLPTFEADGGRLYRRLTMVTRDGRIEHVFYPVHPPEGHADEVLRWLRAQN
jgi:peroxiredoxin